MSSSELPQPSVTVDELWKRYSRSLRTALRYGAKDIVSAIGARDRSTDGLRAGEFWALEDISFEVVPGAAFGVLGRNGAGKSTLLRLLAGITQPDRGSVTVNGSVGTLLDPAVHLDGQLTGRENLLSCAVHAGFTRSEVKDLTEWAEDFAGVGEFFDAPVRLYSMGMRLRVGFASIACTKPDILLIDEALGVGDVEFRRRCGEHVLRHVSDGGSLIFVSHSVFAVQGLCERALVLDEGREHFLGPATEAVDTYLADIIGDGRGNNDSESLDDAAVIDPSPDPVRLMELDVTGLNGGPAVSGQVCRIDIDVMSDVECSEIDWAFLFMTNDQQVCITAATLLGHADISLRRGRNSIAATFGPLQLVPGRYPLKIGIFDRRGRSQLMLHGWNNRPSIITVEADASNAASAPLAAFSTTPLTSLEVAW